MNCGATAPEWGEDAGLPATGADGNVLTSDGTNWASEASAGGGGGGDPMNLWIDGDFTQWLDKITQGTTSSVLEDQNHVSTLIRYEASMEGAEYTGVRSTDVPTQAESGHASKYSLKMLNSGDNGGTVESWDYARLVYSMTGSDYAFIHGGQDVILQFWVRSSMTGTYTVGLQNGAQESRAIPIEYTITAADTWEKKSIAITTDSASETYDLDEEYAGIRIVFSLLSGGDFHGTNNTWGGDSYYYSTDQQVNHGATQGGTFYLSQVGLYKTDTAPASYIGDAIPVVKNKVGYYFRKSYRDFDAPGAAQQIGMVRTEGEFDTSLGGVSNSRTATVTFGSRARGLGDGTQPEVRLYDSACNEDKISLWDLGTESTNIDGNYRYHCESGFQVYTDNSTARNGMSFHYKFDVRHDGYEGGM